MAITPTAGSVTHTQTDGGSNSLLPRYFFLSHVARIQPSKYRTGDNSKKRGYRPNYLNLIEYIGTATIDYLVQGKNQTYFTEAITDTTDTVWESSGELEQYKTGAEAVGSYTDEAPNVFSDETTFDVTSVGGINEGATHHMVRTVTDTDKVAVSGALDYEVFGCHSDPTTPNDWVPFGTGEACSTYEMSYLTCHNTNAVNFRTKHNQAVITAFTYTSSVG
ncbi:MAG: hypothetical protein ACYTBJ_26910 [Planctomycetota bacterium]|jgi:hypothetical protein